MPKNLFITLIVVTTAAVAVVVYWLASPYGVKSTKLIVPRNQLNNIAGGVLRQIGVAASPVDGVSRITVAHMEGGVTYGDLLAIRLEGVDAEFLFDLCQLQAIAMPPNPLLTYHEIPELPKWILWPTGLGARAQYKIIWIDDPHPGPFSIAAVDCVGKDIIFVSIPNAPIGLDPELVGLLNNVHYKRFRDIVFVGNDYRNWAVVDIQAAD